MLTPEQQQAVAQHLNTRAQQPTCPVCGTTSMRVQRDVLALPTAGADTSDIRRVIITCTYCGHDMHFDPDVMGLSLPPSTSEA
ncbi:hypothetical protein [Longibacter sp.]|uniref:hypothetical protein n=1 Tax=Longibacter sp. TaxID=2045415 RepID=UPI003EBAFFE8